MEKLLRVFDALRGPDLARIIWPLVARLSPLTEEEVRAASSVLGPDAVPYHLVRVAEGRLLGLAFRFNGGRAFTTFRTINLPKHGSHARSNMALLVHELVHVYQFESVGSAYIWQALRAQRTEGYKYGSLQGLRNARASGKQFRDFNREQQGQIAQDYYGLVVEGGLAADDPVRRAYEPYIAELKSGDL